jgi:hypothetical protein
MKTPRSRKLFAWLLVPLFVILAGGASIAIDPALRSQRMIPGSASTVPEGEFEQRVRDYILNNPEVVKEAARRVTAPWTASYFE